ncbi:MAG: GNAT family N-acetyltransferase [Halomonas sp.]|nr:GNAT family N-acetyltransferase [Halomonas sp.]
MVTIEVFDPSHVKEVLTIELTEEQVAFAGDAKAFLDEENGSVHRYVIKLKNNVVGFFKLDLGYSERYDFCPDGALGLRAFALGSDYQGKGLGVASVRALFDYAKEHFTGHREIYLTVNCKNPRAHVCYLKGGFENTGELYHGGPAGPQHVMRGQIV